mmetsp:Transcript_33476/g.99782  ORF Transcript_33476/g.99782 Transcript_33476/m.99782 type:complete len:129 (+) Transcript_33476:1533-1919(+)
MEALQATARIIGTCIGGCISMCSGGAIAALLAGIGADHMNILGLCQCGIIVMHCLHASVWPFLWGFAGQMVAHGECALIPGQEQFPLPDNDQALSVALPPLMTAYPLTLAGSAASGAASSKQDSAHSA